MTDKLNLNVCVTGRVATKGNGKDRKEVAILNLDNESRFFAGKDPKDFDKKLDGFNWETTVGKSGEHYVTRYFLESDNKVEIDTKYVRTLDGIRYSCKHAKRDEFDWDNKEVQKLMNLRGLSHGESFTAKFDKIMNQALSMLNDKSRPLSMETRMTMLKFTDRLYQSYREKMLNEQPQATSKKSYGIVLR